MILPNAETYSYEPTRQKADWITLPFYGSIGILGTSEEGLVGLGITIGILVFPISIGVIVVVLTKE